MGRHPLLVLVGGCSRAGKSWLCGRIAERLSADGVEVVTVGLDAWLVGADARRPESTVIERYDVERIVRDIDELMAGRPIRPPVYDTRTRQRVADAANEAVMPARVILADGVVALAIEPLRQRAVLKVYVETADTVRRRRLTAFYREFKAIPPAETERILAAREREEVPFVRKTKQWADVVVAR
jgi:uridine kinase